MLNRILLISLIIAIAMAVFFKLQSDNRLQRATNAENRVTELETAVNEQDHIIKTFAQAEAKAKEFEKELNNDVTDNLDVVPADYILKQLQSD